MVTARPRRAAPPPDTAAAPTSSSQSRSRCTPGRERAEDLRGAPRHESRPCIQRTYTHPGPGGSTMARALHVACTLLAVPMVFAFGCLAEPGEEEIDVDVEDVDAEGA